ncbi:excalibur calcium-binding domain-containing protein [Roseateles amylovorans]|uniref:Excalibur calcium-binding domain-containing protein n=1 Tax=Roseateles amylovorans TaxID=2978473 RepID=A0ABY6B183_9BURK|nr:excalibur calcium-binding domain-containing protein [Roseateles amylovorans]UXH79152.1 excalibur calcium-binding domain-containing protein [Roseateles amylovorans]
MSESRNSASPAATRSAALTGTLQRWDDARGFGFIAPTHGGRELFVHISAFPRDGSRPTVGETLSYALGRGKDGQPQAVAVVRHAVGQRRPEAAKPATRPAGRMARPHQAAPRRSPATGLVALVLMAAAVGYGFHVYQKGQRPPLPLASERPAERPVVPGNGGARDRCDGRQYCSQMRSCEEATFFLRNCPGTQLDGDGDGVPCESQWCGGR